MHRPIVLCGLGRMGWRVLEYLRTAGFTVVAIDTAAADDDPRLAGVRLVRGDCRREETLRQAGVAEARGVLVLTSDDLTNITTALAVRALAPDVRVVLRMFNQNLLNRLGRAIRNVSALSTSLLTAPLLATTAVTGQGLGAFHLEGREDGMRQVVEVAVRDGSDLAGRRLGAVTGANDVQTLVHLPPGEPPRFLLDIDPEAPLRPGDRLVVCGPQRPLRALLAGRAGEQPPRLLWAGQLRRSYRVLRRTLAELDTLVTVCTLVLVLVVAVSTLVLNLGVDAYNLPTAMFRTISIMATGAEMHEQDFQAGWLKVYVSGLRILGAALTAAFTAIVTNYLLRARLGGALEVRRVPEGGHVVVCGLGPVGFRVVEELVGMGERVVALEVDPSARFVTTTRRLGVPVIVGDATVGEVLRQARAGAAKAVVAATNKDVVNLEIALLVRELNEQQRVVLLQSDPQLAQLLRDGANVRLAVSIPTLAAPAFVAALFGDRVRNVLLVAGRMLALVDLQVQPKDPALDGQAVRTVAVDYRLIPVGLVPASGPPPRALLNARLAPGDRLLGVVALSDLERLLRRQPSSAAFAVEVTACPLPARGWLAGLLRTECGLGPGEAEAALQRLPLRLDHRTRGQAEELLARLLRERVGACVRPMELDGQGR